MDIHITYRSTRRLSMRIGQGGEVRVSAPIGCPREVIENFIEKHRDWITKAITTTAERQKQRQTFYDRLPLDTREQFDDAVRRTHELVLPMLEKYEKLMGVRHTGLHYSNTTSKWGSCVKRTGKLYFSVYLLLLPEWCVEHVVVHELAHLIEPNHSPRFHQIVERYFPRWREARAETKRIAAGFAN